MANTTSGLLRLSPATQLASNKPAKCRGHFSRPLSTIERFTYAITYSNTKGKGNGNVDLCSGYLQTFLTRSGMARVIKGSHSFNLELTFIRWRNKSYLPLPPSLSWYSFTDSVWLKNWVGLGNQNCECTVGPGMIRNVYCGRRYIRLTRHTARREPLQDNRNQRDANSQSQTLYRLSY